MKKKIEKKIPHYIQLLLREFEVMFGLQTYDRAVVLEEKDQKNLAASVRIEEDYQRITIYIYPCFFHNTLKDQRMYLLHEFCHYFTDDLKTYADDLREGMYVTKENIRVANEKAVSRITNILDAFLVERRSSVQKAYAKFLKK